MVFMLLIIVCSVVLVSCAVGPRMYKHYLEDKSSKEIEQVLKHIELVGTSEEKERVCEIRARERAIKLKLIERDQAIKVLESSDIKAKLEDANIDVTELKKLLQKPEDDIVLNEFKLLEKDLERKNED